VAGLVARFYEDVWNRWDDAALDAILAPDFEFRGSLGDQAQGRDGFRAFRDTVRAAAPDWRNEVVDLLVTPGRAAVRLRCTGHHRGVLLGMPPTGRAFSFTSAAFFTAADDRLLTSWVVADIDDLRRQLRSP
jgi:steroid delta-isomerase-like uncharacterized protein